ncbi:hypothetical protein K8352_12555 [Flavobacteriaceae bacterium F89]|uniref:Uncharacterized protein n=1 Tax=Cerina litoralis TaxID=2874477 RepID=A0AAE3EWI9_9FLAO|nr:hypothetical protein [Cerina litoralis]MCG2461583.1 hypothetical protein [Cerina litoralis]
MKTLRGNKINFFLLAIYLVALTVTLSCTKDAQDCLTTGSNSSGRNCEDVIEEDPVFLPIMKTEETKENHLSVTDSTAAVAKLPVRVETSE